MGNNNKFIKKLQEHKRKTTLINSYIIKPKGSEKGEGSPGIKGTPKGSAGGSKGKGKVKNPKEKKSMRINNIRNLHLQQNQSLDGKDSLLEVDATLINGCHKSSGTQSKLVKNPCSHIGARCSSSTWSQPI